MPALSPQQDHTAGLLGASSPDAVHIGPGRNAAPQVIPPVPCYRVVLRACRTAEQQPHGAPRDVVHGHGGIRGLRQLESDDGGRSKGIGNAQAAGGGDCLPCRSSRRALFRLSNGQQMRARPLIGEESAGQLGDEGIGRPIGGVITRVGCVPGREVGCPGRPDHDRVARATGDGNGAPLIVAAAPEKCASVTATSL